EEIGHSVDARLNVTDSPGDEGAIFGAVVQGKELTQDELQGLKSEDDRQVVAIDGQQYLIEKQLNPAGSIGSFYNRSPAIASQLGQPTGPEFQFSPAKWRQNFQNGAIFHSAQGTFSVRGSLGRHYLNLGGQDSQLGLPTSEESYVGNWRQSFEKGTLEWLNNGTAKVTLTTTQVPVNNWKAEYFNNRDLTGNPVFVENLGDGRQSFSRNWGTAAPTNTPSDNFSARMTTQRSFEPGLYQIKVQADDGIRVKVGNESVINRWFDQPFATNSGYFRSNGGTVPIAVEYYERTGGAAVNFSITPVTTKFRDPVDFTQQWKSTVYSWNSSQGSAPPTNFWEGDINSPNAIGEINLGSNTRNDGKKGINVNWGQGAPNGDGNRLPHDFFAMRAFTQADFDGSPYKFQVQGDDGFQLLAINQSTGQRYDITSANQWTQAYSAKEFTSQLPAGRYYMHFHQYEGGGDARFDLSWDKVSSEPPLFSNPSPSNPLRGFVHPLGQSQPSPIALGNHNSWAGQQYAVDLGTSSGGYLGAQVYSMRSGTVVSWNDSTPDKNPNLGRINDENGGITANYLVVKLDDNDGVDDGYRAMYLHLQQGSIPSQLKQVGARVGANQPIGKVGYNGISEGVHLHAEVNKLNGNQTNMWQRQTQPFQWK
ncbi:PA14 domain-containing protein, partial [Microcoleus sp. herbarium14]|uniref:PA14 domain-containing protein n=1 Tax=Microcoleus sp. herbarium14 TaxID=3055439 RepID=UPI002FD0BFE7